MTDCILAWAAFSTAPEISVLADIGINSDIMSRGRKGVERERGK
jgi:hypothetical protein